MTNAQPTPEEEVFLCADASPGDVINCWVCKKEFTVTGKNQRYCSHACYKIVAKSRAYQKKHPGVSYIPMSEPFPCRICGKGFIRKGTREKVCSPECWKNEALQTALQGKTHTPIDTLMRWNQYDYVTYTVNKKQYMHDVHRIVMEHKLGRELEDDEIVHHVNGDKWDNTPDNLELCLGFQPPRQRVFDILNYIEKLLMRYVTTHNKQIRRIIDKVSKALDANESA